MWIVAECIVAARHLWSLGTRNARLAMGPGGEGPVAPGEPSGGWISVSILEGRWYIKPRIAADRLRWVRRRAHETLAVGGLASRTLRVHDVCQRAARYAEGGGWEWNVPTDADVRDEGAYGVGMRL